MTYESLGLDNLPDIEAATVGSDWVRQWEREEPLRYATFGMICLAFEKRLLYRAVPDPEDGLPCRSFARWLRCCAPKGYSTGYQAMRDVEALSDVPKEDVAQLPQSSFKPLKKLSSAVRRQPAVLAAAKESKDALSRHIKANYPDQHFEDDEDIRLQVTSSQKAEILEAIEAEIQAGDGASPGEVVFGWAVNSRLDRQNRMMNAEGKAVAHA